MNKGISAASPVQTSSSSQVNSVYQKYASYLTPKNPWDNVIPIDEVTPFEKSELSKYFHIRLVGHSRIHDIQKAVGPSLAPQILTSSFIHDVDTDELHDFVSFVNKTFFEKFNSDYSKADRDQFAKSAPAAFQYEHRMLRHRFKDSENTVAVLVLIKLTDHPWLKYDTWHVGYWGIDPTIKDRAIRDSIKADWVKTISKLPTPDSIVGLVDDFNIPSQKMSRYFTGSFQFLRLDPKNLS